MIEYSKLSEMTVEQALDMLTDWNWHTERVLIEAILCGNNENINDMMSVAINHNLQGHLTPEAEAIRRRVSKEIREK